MFSSCTVGHTSVVDAAAAYQTFLDNMTWSPFLYYPVVDSDTDNGGVCSKADLTLKMTYQSVVESNANTNNDSKIDPTLQMTCQSQAADHYISVIKTTGIQQV